MTLYKIGKITSTGRNYIILESSYKGEIAYVARPNDFEKDKVVKVFIYEYKYEHSEAIYGFSTFKERILFEDLLSVSGIGPKTAITILGTDIHRIIELIISGDSSKLAEIPGIGLKSSRQIIFEIQEKYVNMSKKEKGKTNGKKYIPSDIRDTLKTLGFNNKQIKYAIDKVKPSDNIELMIEEAIRVISNEAQQITQT